MKHKVTRYNMTIPCPAPETLMIIHTFAKRHGLDEATAAEHLITIGARSWYQARKGGKRTASSMTKAETKARSAKAIAARWERYRAAKSAAAGLENAPGEEEG